MFNMSAKSLLEIVEVEEVSKPLELHELPKDDNSYSTRILRHMLEKYPFKKYPHGLQSELARKLGCSQAHVSKVLAYHGYKQISKSELVSTLNYLIADDAELENLN